MHHDFNSTINRKDSTARLADDQEDCAMWAGSSWQDSTTMQDAVGGNLSAVCTKKEDEIRVDNVDSYIVVRRYTRMFSWHRGIQLSVRFFPNSQRRT